MELTDHLNVSLLYLLLSLFIFLAGAIKPHVKHFGVREYFR